MPVDPRFHKRGVLIDGHTKQTESRMTFYKLLDEIAAPSHLRKLDRRDLPKLAAELRDFIILSVAGTGGHFSSNLGTVELAIALHYVFDTPFDRLVWDVGHQAYAHKILTGRRAAMASLRQRGGMAGFPRRQESEYDTFGAGHSSTSISAALGMAVAAQREGKGRKIVAVIGDGALSAGMAFEALNNASSAQVDMLVILNDNNMSISLPAGALNDHLAKLAPDRPRSSLHGAGYHPEQTLPTAGPATGASLFDELGFSYAGPVGGHDLDTLVPTLTRLASMQGLQFLHVVTRKGKGYPRAESDPVLYHCPGKFDPAQGIGTKSASTPSYSQVFGDWLCDMARVDKRLIGITPAMQEGSGMAAFSGMFPDRYFDVGIAEQHAVTFAAGLACAGMKPVVAIYSTFLQRAYDQLIHDVALQNLPVVLAIDRAGVNGADGPSHAGSFDLTYLRCIPNLTVMTPSDENECRRMLYTAFLLNSPAAVRYPRGAGPGVPIQRPMTALPIGEGVVRREGTRAAILAFGTMVGPALQAAEKLDATVADMRFVRPLDEALVERLAATHELIVTVEENTVRGGAGTHVLEYLASRGIGTATLLLGLPDRFLDHGDAQATLAEWGLDACGIAESIAARLATLSVANKALAY